MRIIPNNNEIVDDELVSTYKNVVNAFNKSKKN